MRKPTKPPVKLRPVPLRLPPTSIQAPILNKKKITRKGLVAYMEQVMTAYAPHLIPQLLEGVLRGAVDTDKGLIEMGLKAYGVLETGGGIVINNSNNQNNAVVNSYSRSFDAITRKLSEQRGEVLDVSGD